MVNNPYYIPAKVVNFKYITAKVADYYGIEPEMIIRLRRKRDIVEKRYFAIWLIHNEIYLRSEGKFNNWREITNFFNYKHHSSVMFAVKTINDLMVMKKYRNELQELQKYIYGNVKFEMK